MSRNVTGTAGFEESKGKLSGLWHAWVASLPRLYASIAYISLTDRV